MPSALPGAWKMATCPPPWVDISVKAYVRCLLAADNFSPEGKSTIYFFRHMLYSNCEQSRRPRVKCHRDGELPGGRRKYPRWDLRTRCCIWENLLYVATILGRAIGRLYIRCRFSESDPANLLPFRPWAGGAFCFRKSWENSKPPLPQIKEDFQCQSTIVPVSRQSALR